MRATGTDDPFFERTTRRVWIRVGYRLVLLILITGHSFNRAHAQDVATDARFNLGGTTFVQLEHRDNLTGPNDHLGTLLYDTQGRVVLHDGRKTWMATGGLVDGRWISFIREFDLDGLSPGPRHRVLTPKDDEKWSTIHLMLQVTDNLCVAFYSTGTVVRAAITQQPGTPFTPVADFEIGASQDWERGCSLESDPGFVTISEDAAELRLWVLYDTLSRENTGGNGWAEVRIDKRIRTVEFVRKHPDNPLPLKLPEHLTARTGGNVDSALRVGGKWVMFYLGKPDPRTYRLCAAVSSDPLFQRLDENKVVAGPAGEERVIEKFHGCRDGNEFLLFYEYATQENDWRTAVRRFQLMAE